MGVQFDSNRNRFIVRWYEDGKKRCRRFETEQDAEAFDATLIRSRGRPSEATTSAAGRTPESRRGDGVYPYKTAKGTRWRFVFRHSGGSHEAAGGEAPVHVGRSMQDFDTHGRKRLLPTFGDMKLAHIDDDHVRAWLSEMVGLVDRDGRLAANASKPRGSNSALPAARRGAGGDSLIEKKMQQIDSFCA